MKNFPSFMMGMVILGIIFVADPGIADITLMDYSPPPSGGGVSPKSPHETIRLESQEVIIRLKSSSYTVRDTIHLFNSGETTTERVGFPKRAMGRPPGPFGRLSEFIRFEVLANGNKIPVTEERDQKSGLPDPQGRLRQQLVKHSSWLVGKVMFPARTGMTIRASYETNYQNCGFGCYHASYIYGTARHWKDNIGKAVFIIDATEKGGIERITPRFSLTSTQRSSIRRRLISENLVRYEIRDIEPLPDAALVINLNTRMRHKDSKYILVHAAMNGRLEQGKPLVEKAVDVSAAGPYVEHF